MFRWVRQLRTQYVCALHAQTVCLIRAAVPCAYACCPLWNSANVRVLPFRPDKSMTRRADETELARQVRHDHARDTGPVLVWAIRYEHVDVGCQHDLSRVHINAGCIRTRFNSCICDALRLIGRMHMHTHTIYISQLHTHMYTCTYAYMYKYTYTYIYAYIHTCSTCIYIYL